MEFWGNSGTEGAGESRKAVARPFEGRCMTYGAEFCGKTEEGDDLDRFADRVSLVALVRLVELGAEGRRDGTTERGGTTGGAELRRDGTTGGRRRGGAELRREAGVREDGATEGRNYGRGAGVRRDGTTGGRRDGRTEIVVLVELVELVELGGRSDGGTELRRDGTTKGRRGPRALNEEASVEG